VSSEQLARLVNFNGSYVNERSNWRAIRFFRDRDGFVVAYVVFIDLNGQNIQFLYSQCNVTDSRISFTQGPLSTARESLTVLSKGNLQSSSGSQLIFTFVPFSEVAGRTYTRISGGSRGILAFGFRASQYIFQEGNGRIIDRPEYTSYTLNNGVVSRFYQGPGSNTADTAGIDLILIGPYLTTGHGEIWAPER
jgi:hypothetical protein